MVKNGHPQGNPSTFPGVGFARREGSKYGVEALDLKQLRRRELNHSIFRAHRIAFHTLCVVTGGRGWHMVDFIRHSIERGTVIHIAPGQISCFDRDNDVRGFLVIFEPEACEVEAPHVRWPATFEPATGDFELVESLVQIMSGLKTRELHASPDRVAWRMLSALLELCDGAVAGHYAQRRVLHSEEFEAFDALLNESFARHRELAWYGRQLGYSEKTLSRWCRHVVGINAKAYIDRRVALEAKRLLVHTDRTVESIAAGLGFTEATNFVKFFKRVEGTTPSHFRRSYD